MAKLTKWGKRSRRDARANEKRLATDREQREQRRQRAAEAGAKAPQDAQDGRSAAGR
jgi:hypothetical protein